jgi:hypothetical protein
MPNVMPIYLSDAEQARLQHYLPTVPRDEANLERTRSRAILDAIYYELRTGVRAVAPTSENHVTVPCASATSSLMRAVASGRAVG